MTESTKEQPVSEYDGMRRMIEELVAERDQLKASRDAKQRAIDQMIKEKREAKERRERRRNISSGCATYVRISPSNANEVADLLENMAQRCHGRLAADCIRSADIVRNAVRVNGRSEMAPAG